MGEDNRMPSNALSRRDALLGLGALGAGTVASGTYSALESTLSDDDAARVLPTNTFREVWGDRKMLEQNHLDYPAIASRGVSQTNLTVVDDEQSWRNPCDGVPGIEHRFTVSGFLWQFEAVDFEVSIDGDGCGNAALTPYYSWEGSAPLTDDTGEPPQSPAELESFVREAYGGETFEPEQPRTYDSFFDATGMIVGGLALAPIALPGLAAVGTALTVGELAFALRDHLTPTVYSDVQRNSFGSSVSNGHGHTNIVYVWADFGVVVPSGEGGHTVTVDFDGEMARWDYPDFSQRTFEIDIPAIDHDQDLSTVETPTISAQNPPIEAEVRDDNSVALASNLPDHQREFEDPEWFNGETAETILTDRLLDGPYSVSYQADHPDYADGENARYRATTSVLVGDPPFDASGVPDASFSLPDDVGVGDTVTVTGEASSPDGDIHDHEWILKRGVRDEGYVVVDSQSGEGQPEPFEASFDEAGGYELVLEVTDYRRQTGRALEVLVIGGEELDVTIDGPETVGVDQSASFSYDVANADTLDSWAWIGAFTSGAHEPDVSFDEPGEKEARIEVADGDGGFGSDTYAFDVVSESPLDVSIDGPETAQDGDTLTFSGSATSPNGAVASHRWEVEEGVEYEGFVTIDTVSGSGLPEDLSTTFDSGGYRVTLTVTDVYGLEHSVSQTVVVEGGVLSVSIDGPEVVETGDDVTFSYDVVETDTLDSWNWIGAFDSQEHAPEVTFDDPGEKQVTLEVADGDGNFGSTTHSFEVVSSSPLSVSLSGPETINAGETVDFSGTASSPNGAVASHRWEVEEGVDYEGYETIDTESGSGQPEDLSTTFETGGYRVTLEVTDEYGETDAVSRTVHVEGIDLTVDIEAPSRVDEGDTVDFGFSVEETDTVDTASWSGAFTSIDYEPSETFSEPGTYGVNLEVFDGDGNSGTDSHEIDVRELGEPSVSVSGTSSAYETERGSWSASASSPNGSIVEYDWHVVRDGTSRPVDDGSGSSHSYEFGTDGDYTVGVVVTDSAGQTASDSMDVDVDDPGSPSVSISGPSSTSADSTETYSANVSADVDVADYDWTGKLSSRGGSDSTSGSGSSFTYSFSSSTYSYTISVDIEDEAGGTASDTLSVDVS